MTGATETTETVPVSDERAAEIAGAAQALSDPIRVKMLAMMASGRGCCPLPESPAPGAEEEYGLCICDFEGYFSMAQSKVSYHMKKLKDANLVNEQKRGRWHYYSVNRGTLAVFASKVESLTESASEG